MDEWKMERVDVMTMSIYSITMLLTALVCIAIVVIAIIRLRVCEGGHRARLKYTLVVSSGFVGVVQPVLFFIWPGAAALCLSAMFLVVLVSGVPPLQAYKDTDEFFDTSLYDPRIHGEE